MVKKKINFEPILYIVSMILLLMVVLSVLELRDKEIRTTSLENEILEQKYQVLLVRQLWDESLTDCREKSKEDKIKILDLERQIGILKRHKCYEW